MLDFLLACLVVVAVCYIAPQIYEKLHPEEDFFSDEAIKLAKEKRYPANLSYEEIMQYKAKERIAILGLNNFEELYKTYPEYLRPVEKRHLATIGKIILTEEDALQLQNNETRQENVIDDVASIDDELLEDRMAALHVSTYTDMCRDYPEYVTREEFESLLKQGLINSVDDHIVFKGKYYENEFSEEWEE
ncbi:MAG: hypothetical protein IJ967_03865, partial [Phascolarctobacterium sp.]|nr:hypothetical protein [Phascolarctobacterium sp.]